MKMTEFPNRPIDKVPTQWEAWLIATLGTTIGWLIVLGAQWIADSQHIKDWVVLYPFVLAFSLYTTNKEWRRSHPKK